MPAAELRRVIFAADLAGTFVFATEGALAAIDNHLDLFGVLVLSFATALCGGVARDVLIGAIPPRAIRDWRYPVTAFTAGAIAFLAYELIRQVPPLCSPPSMPRGSRSSPWPGPRKRSPMACIPSWRS